MEYANLFEDFAAAIGIADGPAFDADGVWRMASESVTFAFSTVPETDELLIFSELFALPEKGDGKFKTALLRANFMNRGTEGAVLSLSDNDRVCLHRRARLDGLTVEALVDIFECFVRVALEWQAIMRDFSAADGEAVSDESSDGSDVGGSQAADGFIHV